MKRALAFSLLLPGLTQASGLSVPVTGTSLSGPVHVDPAATFWNPALLARFDRPTLLAGVSVLYLDAKYTRERRGTYQFEDSLRFATPVPADDIDGEKTSKSKEVRAQEVLPAPQIFLALPLADGVVAGLGLFAPFGAGLGFSESGDQRFALTEVNLAVVEIAPALAWAPHERFSIGIGGGLVAGQLTLSKVQDLAGTDLLHDALGDPPIGQANDFGPQAPSEVRELLVLARPVRIGPATGVTWAARAGVAFEPTDDLLLGASYTHREPIVFKGEFRLDMNDSFFTNDLAPQGLRYPAIVRGEATVDFPLPPSLHVGARWQASSKWAAAATGTWVRHSVVEALGATLRSNALVQPELGLGDTAEVNIPRRWEDTWHVDARLQHASGGGHDQGFLLGFHTGASPDETLDVASPDGPRVVGALQATWPIGSWGLITDVQVQYVLPRTNTGSDFDLGNGEYSLLLAAATVALQHTFE